MWGIPVGVGQREPELGITPTCVGNTDNGEKRLYRVWGSPPRVWGIRPVRALNALDWRITPTCVGNTNMLRPSAYGSEDHPHVCGEYQYSSPRTYLQSRITPTCVGNTNSIFSFQSSVQDHPHVCGEYPSLWTTVFGSKGSPPRVWGIRQRPSEQPNNGRITPTCVGNTIFHAHFSIIGRDHPHVCGEYCLA